MSDTDILGTEDVDTLIAVHDGLERDIAARRKTQHEIDERIEAIHLARRPEYPTQAQRDGIVEACRRIREQVFPESHHGDPTPTYDVVVDGARGWMNIRVGAPYRRRSGGRLWFFTDAERDMILDLVRAEGFAIADWWPGGDGMSILVAPKPSNAIAEGDR